MPLSTSYRAPRRRFSSLRAASGLAVLGAACLAACSSSSSGGGGGNPGFDGGFDAAFDVGVDSAGDSAAASDAPAEVSTDSGHDAPSDAPADSGGWSPVGGGKVDPGAASFGRIAAMGGKVYAAFSDNMNGGNLTVMENGGGATWTVVGAAGFTPTLVDATNMAITVDGSGAPWVAYVITDSDSGQPYLFVSKFTAGSWVTQGGGAVSSITTQVSLVVMGGAPYVAFLDGSNLPHVMTASGGTWADVGTTPDDSGLDSGVPTFASTLVLGTDGTTLYLAYDDGAGNAVLTKDVGGAWSTLATTTTTIDEPWDPKIIVSAGKVFLSFLNFSNGAVVLELNGTSLQSVGALGDIAGGDSIESVSGTVYNGTPYVAFDDESRDGDETPEAATVKDWNGSNWVLYAGYPNPCDIEETVLTADPSNGHLYLTYSDCSGDMFVQVH
jgi:hypothetical protein